ncbi:PRK06851 family protein [Heyndrickxia coagulans]|uniref:PRK06851 family protein n=1 Tax=Heyndrickxia coagulans TaxID=1398 RepID=UPI001F3B6F62|nr:PRK06851 family protein [Heyndrickxia coagulans]MED4343701.1 PRK06851 family protein [Heyndrickxia coagulans]UJZ87093.1 PRK06851 family protein [Heyndrickxia coagulans]
MARKVLHYFAGGNTGKGFAHYLDSSLQGLDRVFILNGRTGKSYIMEKLAEAWKQKGYDLELIHCPSAPDSLDGLMIPGLKTGVVDGNAPYAIEPKANGSVMILEDALDAKYEKEVLQLNRRIQEAYQSAYKSFAESLRHHDDLEAIYLKEMDFEKAGQVTQQLIEKLFGGKTGGGSATVYHRFLGAATPNGAVDFIPNLTEGLSKRYFIKGRAGTGKSTMLKEIAAKASEKGFTTEIYHCGFDPNSLDMVIVRELGFCIFDSTDPHEYFPERNGDEVIDMYAAAVTPGTDEKYANEIQAAHKRYKDKMKEGTAWLHEAKVLNDKLEMYYDEALDFAKADQIYLKINQGIQEAERLQTQS